MHKYVVIIIIKEVITLRRSGENGRNWKGKGRANDRTLTCNILRKKIVN